MDTQTFYPSLSRYMSTILDVNGLKKNLRQRRRELFLRMEVLKTNTDLLSGKRIANYHFGSQTEATTIHYFHSDVDTLFSFTDFDVKQSVEEWRTGSGDQSYRKYKLMLNTDQSPPGYARLQDISEITPEKLFLGDLVEDGGKYFYSSANVFHVLEEAGTVRQGPSKTDERELPNRLTADRVYAYPCRSWPVSLQEWMVRKRKHGWPSPHLMMMAMSKGCFLVPVGHKLSDNSDLEWRLSPSLAERMLMFSLSETHIKCYVLLKHIVKYIVKPILGPSLTSFHCKTAVLTLAERTPWDMWTPDRLMECMDMCLGLIISWCRTGWCPNYLLPRENLFAGRMNTQKLADLMEILLTVYNSRWRILLILDDWGLGEALELAFTGCPYLLSNNEEATVLSLVPGAKIECMSNERYFEKALRRTEKAVESFVCHQWPVELAIQAQQILIDADDPDTETCFQKLVKAYQMLNDDKERLTDILVQDVLVAIMPIICLFIGCVISALPGRRENAFWWSMVYKEWTQQSFKQYRIMASLKLATVLLFRGVEFDGILQLGGRLLEKLDAIPEGQADADLINQFRLCQKAVADGQHQDDFRIVESILDHIETSYMGSIISVCPCRLMTGCHGPYFKTKSALPGKHNCTCCVFFLKGEINIVPFPLKFEFFRSSEADRATRDPYKDQWMDLAVVDTVIYVYFLQYVNYRHQDNQHLRERTLLKLMKSVDEAELFHRETALNLLGYCLLLEGRVSEAFSAFSRSLRLQPINNCAPWHMALMLNKLLHMPSAGSVRMDK